MEDNGIATVEVHRKEDCGQQERDEEELMEILHQRQQSYKREMMQSDQVNASCHAAPSLASGKAVATACQPRQDKATKGVAVAGEDLVRDGEARDPGQAATRYSTPGAYAEAPSFLNADEESDDISSNTQQGGAVTGSTASSSEADVEAIATMIEDPTDRSDIQQALPVDLESPPSSSSRSRRVAFNRKKSEQPPTPQWGRLQGKVVLGTVLVLVIFFVTALLVLLPASEKAQGSSSNQVVATVNGKNTSDNPLKDQLLALLASADGRANVSQFSQSLQDASSPQSKAFQWLLQDPHLQDYLQPASANRIRQRVALATLYHATKGENWTYNDGWMSYQEHECEWFSKPDFAFFVPNIPFPVYANGPCDSTNTTYQHIWLWQNNLQGIMPEEIYWLTNLKSISTFRNPLLTGTISTSIGKLRQLEGVTLAQNSFTGTLPTELGLLRSSLYYFSVFGNNLQGSIPSQLGLLNQLETVILDYNQFTSTIPHQLFQEATKLVLFYAGNNRLSGFLPTQIGNLVSLKRVHLDANQLTGMIPSQIGQLQALLDFGMVGNDLSGSLPAQLGNALNLRVLELQSNSLSGSIPSELGAANLTHLLLQDNLLTGTLPAQMLELVHNESALKALNMSGNPLGADLCWVQSSFFSSAECNKHHPSPSCGCRCSC